MSEGPKNKKENGWFTKVYTWLKENVQLTASKQQQVVTTYNEQFTRTMEAVSKRFSANDAKQPNTIITNHNTLRFSSLPEQQQATSVADISSPQVKPTIH